MATSPATRPRESAPVAAQSRWARRAHLAREAIINIGIIFLAVIGLAVLLGVDLIVNSYGPIGH